MVLLELMISFFVHLNLNHGLPAPKYSILGFFLIYLSEGAFVGLGLGRGNGSFFPTEYASSTSVNSQPTIFHLKDSS